MNILLLCDRKSTNDDIQMQGTVQGILERSGHTVQTVVLSRDEIKPCVGCFGCWVKTPGSCVIVNDAANNIASYQVNADAIVLLSEITYGGFSADMKSFLDRSIQNILPFFKKYKGEMHHPGRYERFPFWIAIGYGSVNDAEKQTFIRLADRNALNMRPAKHLALSVLGSKELEDVADRINETLGVSA